MDNSNMDQDKNQSDEPAMDQDKNQSDEPAIDCDANNVEGEKTGSRTKRSFVWDHFTYVDGSNKMKVKCPYCRLVMAAATKSNGTSAMSSHLRLYCKCSPLFKKQNTKKQSKISFKPKSLEEDGGGLATHTFKQEKARKALSRMCIKDNRPFSVVDDEGLREFAWELNPMFKFPSRWTIARDCLTIYQEEKKKLKQLLRNHTISLTTDTWTSVQNYNYMCLTAHWVDENWILRKKIINFCKISNHKGITVGKLVYRCLQEWGIDSVFTVMVDNASSNDGAIKILKSILKGHSAILDCKYMHLRCCAHIINLVVRDGLDEHFDSISKIRNVVRYLRSSPSRYDIFQECVDFEKITCKIKPCLDVETRWNSTFLMLETAVKYSKAFDRLQAIDKNYQSYFSTIEVNDIGGGDDERNTRKRKKNDRVLGAPDEDDWENARHFIEYLKIFHDVTKRVSGSKYVTSNLFVGELVTMHATISHMCSNGDEKKKKMALLMKEKYDKYWENLDNMNFLLHVALVLDPRNKMSFLKYCLGLIYGMNSVKCKSVVKKVEDTLIELFDHYKNKMDNMNEQSPTSSSTPTAVNLNIHDGYQKYLEEHGGGVKATELDTYLTDGIEKMIIGDEIFDVLGWWKQQSVKFPILSQMAKHVLGMPISTVASESAFSMGGRVIDKFRSSLTPKTAEALICTQDWLRSTPADLQEIPVNGLSLEDLMENLEKIENDLNLKGKKPINDFFVDLEEE